MCTVDCKNCFFHLHPVITEVMRPCNELQAQQYPSRLMSLLSFEDLPLCVCRYIRSVYVLICYSDSAYDFWVSSCQGRSQRGPRGPCPPIVDWVDFLTQKMALLRRKVTLFSLSEVFCGPQICQNALAHDVPPDHLVGWGGETPSQSPSPRRLDYRAFGAQLLWPQCKILAKLTASCSLYAHKTLYAMCSHALTV